DAGQRVAYRLFRKNPAQPLVPISELVPADQVVHLFTPGQVGLQRGTSWLSGALLALYELATYSESAVVRARTSSLFCGFVRSADGSNILTNDSGEATFEPGSLVRLRNGDEISFTSPPDPSNSFAPFVATLLRQIAAALSLPYELL